MNYTEAKRVVLENDVALRDIIIPINNVNEYKKLLTYITNNGYKIITEIDGNPADVNECIRQISLGAERLIGLTKLFINDIQLNIWYLDASEIEIDFSVSEVNSEDKWDSLMSFIWGISQLYSTDIGIFMEGNHSDCLCNIRS